MIDEDMITVDVYAKKHGRDVNSVRYHCRAGNFKTAQKINRRWYVSVNEKPEDGRLRRNRRKKAYKKLKSGL